MVNVFCLNLKTGYSEYSFTVKDTEEIIKLLKKEKVKVSRVFDNENNGFIDLMNDSTINGTTTNRLSFKTINNNVVVNK